MEQSVLLKKFFVRLNQLGYTGATSIPDGLQIQIFWLFENRETDKAHKNAANILDFVLFSFCLNKLEDCLHQGNTLNTPTAY